MPTARSSVRMWLPKFLGAVTSTRLRVPATGGSFDGEVGGTGEDGSDPSPSSDPSPNVVEFPAGVLSVAVSPIGACCPIGATGT